MAIEQIRMVLIIALCVVSFLLWDAWQRDYGPRPPPQPASTEQPPRDVAPSDAASPKRRCSASTASGAYRSNGTPGVG